MIRARLTAIARLTVVIECELQRRIDGNPGFADTHKRLIAVKGVGPVLAPSLITDMPELGYITSKAAAALVGVAPYAR